MRTALIMEVVEYGGQSHTSRYCEVWAYGPTTDPLGDHIGPGATAGTRALPRAIARAMECGPSTIIIRPLAPQVLA